jgi:anti-sigma regulatory factor (Ser/Thr protein kinase)
VLHEWGLRELADDAALVVSELITNAADASIVVPGHPAIALRLLATGTSVVIEAWDQSPLDLEPRDADGDDECGRGLTVGRYSLRQSSGPSPWWSTGKLLRRAGAGCS